MKIVIVGGVAGGASTAARARRLDENADIIVLERGGHVSFANCGLPYHIGGRIRERDRLLLQTPRSLHAMLNLDVRVGHEAVSIDRANKTVSVIDRATDRRYDESYDKLVLSPGASPIRPNLPGIDNPRILALRNIADMDAIKKIVDGGARSAIVIGGGYIGVEMAENLRERGLTVDLVEMCDQILPPLDREMTHELETHMRLHGVCLHLGAAAASFKQVGDRITAELSDGTTLSADLVVLSVGVCPESTLAKTAGLELGSRRGIKVNQRLQTSDPDIYAAGDVVEIIDHVTGLPAQIPLAGPANRQGRVVADNIFGKDSIYRTTKGTAVVKIFDMTAGGTGASERTLRNAKIPYEKIYIHPSGHAGYYPGTAPMHIKLLFAPDTGKVLGAQVVGYDGIDKRLDVFATAICGGLTVRDLSDLELAYAPPFGSARDAVNMAGLVASNLLDGDIEVWHAAQYPDETREGTLLDVRTPQEFDIWHIPGAVNIPLSDLRTSLDRIPRDKRVFAYCKVGFRSYLAYRILKQKGYRVRTLSGGTMTFCAYHGDSVCKSPADESIAPTSVNVEPYAGYGPGEGRVVELDLCGLQCPGPIRKLVEAMNSTKPGDEIMARATDPGFASDVPAWCKRMGHTLIELKPDGTGIVARIRKGGQAQSAPSARACGTRGDKKTMVVFSGDLDKVLASFIIANGAASMGNHVTMFFTFWGLNALRKQGPQAGGKSFLDMMFGWMMPKGANALKLSNMNMLGAGTAMMKYVMRKKNVDSLSDLMASARKSGVKLVACAMSMDIMGIKREELLDDIEIGGVASFLGESDEANMTLFV